MVTSLMGDKSPKATNKKANQKASAGAKKKGAAPAAPKKK